MEKSTIIMPKTAAKQGELDQSQLKAYSAPTLTAFGGISELVQSLAGLGPDGGPIPPLTFS